MVITKKSFISKSSEMNPHLNGQLIYKGVNTQWEKVCSVNVGGKTGQLHAKESNWNTFSHHIQK